MWKRLAANVMKGFVLSTAMSIFVGCGNAGPGAPQKASDVGTTADPCKGMRELNPHCGWNPHWINSGHSINAIDGTKTDFLSLDSSSPDGLSSGRLSYAVLELCFEKGKLCGHKAVGAGVDVNGTVQPLSYESEYSTSVRIKFDDERLDRETWGIAANRKTLFPRGREEQFLSQLLQHEQLVLEFSYYEESSTYFDISDIRLGRIDENDWDKPKDLGRWL